MEGFQAALVGIKGDVFGGWVLQHDDVWKPARCVSGCLMRYIGSLKTLLRLIPSNNALGGFHAFFNFVHQGNAYIALARVAVFGVAGEEASGQHLHACGAV